MLAGHFQEAVASGCSFKAASRVFAPSTCVGFHDLKFAVAQPAGLEQHVIGNGHFPDVVQRAGLIHELLGIAGAHLLLRVGLQMRQMLGQNLAIASHAFQVRAGFGVARFGEDFAKRTNMVTSCVFGRRMLARRSGSGRQAGSGSTGLVMKARQHRRSIRQGNRCSYSGR